MEEGRAGKVKAFVVIGRDNGNQFGHNFSCVIFFIHSQDAAPGNLYSSYGLYKQKKCHPLSMSKLRM